MRRAFRSEWVKLGRWRQILAVWGTMAALMVLFTTLIFANAAAPAPPPPECSLNPPNQTACAAALAKMQASDRRGPQVPITDLEKPAGLVGVLRFGGNVLGIVTLVLFAGNLAAEYGNGTLKVILSRDPRRIPVLAGKLTALYTFAAVGIVLAAAAEMGTATVIASARNFDTSQWWTAQNGLDTLAFVSRVLGGAAVWGSLGALLAILLRSGPAAIGLGIGYVIVGEGLLSLALPDVVRLLPGQIVAAFEAYGAANPNLTNPVDFGLASLLLVAYLVGFLALSSLVFWRRDVGN